ncbi:MAG: hypothetical protein IJX97_06920 [Clostridia bacterium]|nr:hypothetical protein [Clostridia bacterium]
MRGYQRKVIFLKDTGSSLFDEAYFFVSRKGEEAKVEQSDMILEANRIIKESLGDKESRLRGEKKFFKKSFLIPFFLGAFITSILILGIYFILISIGIP